MRYAERRIRLAIDPASIAALLAATSTDEYAVYEGLNDLSFTERAFQTLTFTANTNPAEIADALLRVEIEDWRSYGWATFELSHAQHGLDSSDDTEGMHLMIPEREVRLEQRTALLHALDPAALDGLEARVTGSILGGRGDTRTNRRSIPTPSSVMCSCTTPTPTD